MRTNVNKKYVVLSLLAAFSAAPMFYSGDADAAYNRFGVHCQQDFEGGWAGSLPYTYERCNRFANRLDDTDTKVFHYNLVNKQYYWHDTGDQAAGSLEDVGIFFAATHGGISDDGNFAGWGMWNRNVTANSDAMRLGDEGYHLGIFATYACYTQSDSDGRQLDRWYRIFDGGLRLALGSHGILWAANYTSEVGEEFANGLQQGRNMISAWHDGLTDWYFDQDISGIATGKTDANCQTRLWYMTWFDWTSPWDYPALRDWDWIYMCYAAWHE